MNFPFSADRFSLGLLMKYPMECEAFRSILEGARDWDIVVATSDFEFGMARCDNLAPNVLIFDPCIHGDSIERVYALSCSGLIESAVVLDQRLREWRIKVILEHSNFSYITRQSGLETLITSIEQISKTGQRVFDPSIQSQIRFDSPGVKLNRNTNNHQSLAQLTPRELEVLKLLANGHSVKRCAELLDLAESTIDNHKSRLMKKLDIHKTTELVLLAIREGLLVA